MATIKAPAKKAAAKKTAAAPRKPGVAAKTAGGRAASDPLDDDGKTTGDIVRMSPSLK